MHVFWVCVLHLLWWWRPRGQAAARQSICTHVVCAYMLLAFLALSVYTNEFILLSQQACLTGLLLSCVVWCGVLVCVARSHHPAQPRGGRRSNFRRQCVCSVCSAERSNGLPLLT